MCRVDGKDVRANRFTAKEGTASPTVGYFLDGDKFIFLLFSGFIYYLVQKESVLSYVVGKARDFMRETQEIALDTFIQTNPTLLDFTNRYTNISERLEGFHRELLYAQQSGAVSDMPIDLIESYLSQLHELYATDLSIWYAAKRYEMASESIIDSNIGTPLVHNELGELGDVLKDFIETSSSRERAFIQDKIVQIEGQILPRHLSSNYHSQRDCR